MGSRARIGGQPINQFLAVVPIALFATAFLFDLGALLSGWSFFGEVGYWDLTAGLAAAVLALAAGLLDVRAWLAGPAVRRSAFAYATFTATMVVLFGLAWWDRMAGGHAGGAITFLVELLATGAGGAAVWLGRGLVVAGEREDDPGALDVVEHGFGDRGFVDRGFVDRGFVDHGAASTT